MSAEREPSLEPTVRDGPDHAADGRRGRQEPEPDLVHAQPLAGVEDEHGPRRPERDVEREDRERQRPHRRMRDEPPDALDHVGAPSWPAPAAPPSYWWRRARRAARRARNRPRSSRTAGPCRPRTGTAPIGGATSWFVRRNAPCIRALAMPRSSRATRPGSSVLLAASAKVSAVPSTNRVTSTTAMLTVPVTMVATRTASTTARTEVHDDDDPPTIEAVGGRATQDAEQQHRQVLAQQRHRHEERIARLRRDEQRPGRERDAVAGVVDDRGRQEPAEAPSEPRRGDGSR